MYDQRVKSLTFPLGIRVVAQKFGIPYETFRKNVIKSSSFGRENSAKIQKTFVL